MVVVDPSEDPILSSLRSRRYPEHLHCRLIHPLGLILVINPGEKPGIESHLTEERSLGRRVTKGVNMPPHSWDISKFPQEKLMSDCHLVDNVLIVGSGLIIHAPPTIDKLELALLDELLHFFLQVSTLLFPPLVEEGYFHINKFFIGV